MGIKAIVIRNVLARWFWYFVSIIIGLFMFPFVIHRLGDPVYGIWILVGSLTGYLGILDLGIALSMVKYISEFKARDDRKALEQVVSSAFLLYCFIGLVSFLIACLLAFIAPKVFDIGILSERTVRYLIMIVGFQIAIGFPLSIFEGILKGYQRYDMEAYIEAFAIGVRTLLIVVFLLLGYGVVALALMCLVSSIVGHFLRLGFSMRFLKKIRINIKSVKIDTLRLIFNYSWPLLVMVIAGKIVFHTDSIVIGIFMSASAITYYAVGWRLLSCLRQLIELMAATFIPVVSEFGTEKTSQKNQRLLITTAKYASIIILFIGMVLIFFGRRIINFWIGDEYVAAAYPVLVILTISELFGMSQSPAGAVILGLAKHKFAAIVNSIQAVANLILSIILVRYLGLVGVALGTAVPYIFFSIFVYPPYVCRLIDLPVFKYIKKAFLPPLLGSIPFILFCSYLSTKEIANIIELFTAIALCFVVFSIGIYATCFSRWRYASRKV